MRKFYWIVLIIVFSGLTYLSSFIQSSFPGKFDSFSNSIFVNNQSQSTGIKAANNLAYHQEILSMFPNLTSTYRNKDKGLHSLRYFGQNIDRVKVKGITPFNLDKNYKNGLLKSEYKKLQFIANYNLAVKFNVAEKRIYVTEEILWNNKTKFATNEIWFHLYANAYKSNKTVFAKYYKLLNDEKTELKIKEIRIDGKEHKLIYVQPDFPDPYDSTVALVRLNKTILPGDSVKIYFNYSMRIPRSVKRLGHAAGKNFFFVSQWFPKVGVFQKGKWICNQYYPHTNFYSDFGKYRVHLTVPKNYKVAATGVLKSKVKKKESTQYYFIQDGVHDFAWLAADDILIRKRFFTRLDGSKLLVEAFVQPNRKRYINRYFNAVFNSLKFFENRLGAYPYQTLTLVDVPRSSASGGMEYPTLFTVRANLFSPIVTHQPERLVIHEFTHQYFYGLLANNEVAEAWLDEGFTSYFTAKIVSKYYGKGELIFRIANYYPVYGIDFLSYNDIPVIYTLGKFKYNEITLALKRYYNSLYIGAIADSSFRLPTRLAYVTNAYIKPEIMLFSLERILGKLKMKKVMKIYFDNFEFKHPTAEDFINIVKKVSGENLDWFFDNVYKKSRVFDYTVKSIKKISDSEYGVLVERLGDGIFSNDVALYTNKDTLYAKWDGKKKWEIIKFHTNYKPYAAEIDPYRKDLFDINFANNSYTIKQKYWASLSLAIKWFFWMQNAVIILGSAG